MVGWLVGWLYDKNDNAGGKAVGIATRVGLHFRNNNCQVSQFSQRTCMKESSAP